MLDHIVLKIRDPVTSRAFYSTALAPLGIGVAQEYGGWVGFGTEGPDGRARFWLGAGASLSGGIHLAFTAASRAEVDAFHAAALKAGAQDNGAPGLRPHYHDDYYGAFVIDPDGHNIEAVCHLPPV